LRQTAFLQQVAPELADYPRLGVVFDRPLVLFHNTCLAKPSQQSLQRFRIASADSLLPASESQKSIHYLAVQITDIDMFLLKPSAEIGDYDDLLSDRVAPVALFGHTGSIGVEVFTQRPLAQSFNCA